MNDARTTSADDNLSKPDRYLEKRPVREGETAVYVLVVHPNEMTSFVRDVVGGRDEAETARCALEERWTAVSIEKYLVEPQECPVPEVMGDRDESQEWCRCSTTECPRCGSEDIRHHHAAINDGCPPDTACVMITCDCCGETV